MKDMKDALRIAIRYHNWMDRSSKDPIKTFRQSAQENLACLATTTDKLAWWTDQFFHNISGKDKGAVVSHGVWDQVANSKIPDIASEAKRRITSIVSNVSSSTNQKEDEHLLSLKDLVNEIRAVSTSFKTKVHKGHLIVKIAQISLNDGNEEVFLGDFNVHLNPSDPTNFTIESIDKVASEGGYYHPHVNTEGSLCQGDGSPTISEALQQGRLEDFFTIVQSILRTYNDDSPYESLGHWYGEGGKYCESCEENGDPECFGCCESCNCEMCEYCWSNNSTYCEHCDYSYCDSCSVRCYACDNWFCNNCIACCYGCSGSVCSDCVRMCEGCNEPFCDECASECQSCGGNRCNGCAQECPSCNERHCEECLEIECEKCNKQVCKNCETSCSDCDKEVMCDKCESEHNCQPDQMPLPLGE